MRLADLARPVTVVACTVDFGHIFPWTLSEVTLETDDGVRYSVGIGHYGDDEPFTANRTVGGLPAMLTRHEGRTDRPNDVSVRVPLIDGIAVTVSGGYRDTDGRREYVPTTDADVLAIADAVRVGPNFDRPHTWPTLTA
jgi:hypothetical protein